ncbi:MAG: rod shape-determining protein RodA [Acidobacteria bacterium]|nr:rod shape-determining protein RodA [Acidobacteriota bacterium]
MENRIDPWLLLAVFAILGGSAAMLASLGRVMGSHLLGRQLLWGVLGIVVLWLVSRFSSVVLYRLAPIAYGAALALLVAVLIVGNVRSGTRGWFVLGPVSFQPSEIARLATALMIAAWYAGRKDMRFTAGSVAVLVFLIGLPVGLILLEPDLGVALTYLPIALAALWIGGLPARAWVAIGVAGILLAGATWTWGLKPYQKDRILTVLEPARDPFGAGYQVRQSKIAIGSGMVMGQGLGRGSQSVLRFLPAQHTDFIFAAWAEATGFAGGSLLLAAYALLLWRISRTALVAKDRFGLVISTLIGAWLAFQILVNLSMVVGWLPTTGITLPLFSYGGSSLVTTCAALGVVSAVWRDRFVNV